MTRRRFFSILALAGWTCCLTSTAGATVSAFFSSGGNCQGKPVAVFSGSDGGKDINVTLCLSATEEAICGHSVQLEAESAIASGRFQVVAHRMGENYPDPTIEKLPGPVAVTNPASPHDFGGTRDNPKAPSANQVLVLFTLRPSAAAKDASYSIRLGKNSLVSVGKNGSCLENAEVPISASLKLERK
ncbi:MAG: hypothetical protein ABI790_08855 [Betaproteobacteria bacterium]